MPLHQSSIDKIKEIDSGYLLLFKAIEEDTVEQGLDTGTLIIPMFDEDSDLQPGDTVAELHFVVRRVPDDYDAEAV